MPDEYRVTIRLSPELYAQLEARGSRGQPMAVIVRHALVDYLSRQPDAPQSAVELATAVAAMAARLDGLQQQMDALTAQVDALAANRQPPAARSTPQPARPGQTPAATRQPTAADVSPLAADRQPVAASTPSVAAERQPVADTARQRRRSPTRPGLPQATLAAIAEERTQCEGLSFEQFAQRLHTKGIYSQTAKDGSKVPANRGTVKKVLDRARDAGLL
jgi:hypothetical protein